MVPRLLMVEPVRVVAELPLMKPVVLTVTPPLPFIVPPFPVREPTVSACEPESVDVPLCVKLDRVAAEFTVSEPPLSENLPELIVVPALRLVPPPAESTSEGGPGGWGGA